MNNEEYIKELENLIKKFIKPIEDIPFKIAIKALTNCEVLNFGKNDERNKELLDLLIKATIKAGNEMRQKGLIADRPNEAGNKVEVFLLNELNNNGLKANKPISKNGKTKQAGYPDLEIIDRYGRTTYIECKTYSLETRDQTFRTFYFSPTEDPKVTKDAFHILISYELQREKDIPNKYIPVSWHIYDLSELKVQIKHEFNASNKDLYREDLLLAEGSF